MRYLEHTVLPSDVRELSGSTAAVFVFLLAGHAHAHCKSPNNYNPTETMLSTENKKRSYIQQVSAAADRPVRRDASRPLCCIQMRTVSEINW